MKIKITVSDVVPDLVNLGKLRATFAGKKENNDVDDSVDDNGDIWFTQAKGKVRKKWQLEFTMGDADYKFVYPYLAFPKDDDNQAYEPKPKTDKGPQTTISFNNKNEVKSRVTYELVTDDGNIHPLITNRNGD